MPLTSGTRLGPYEILSSIGVGGMGEVYRARDTKLGRAVAIKVILDEFASDQERVGRFEREAKMLAALNHPRIASLFGMERVDGQHFLVMELIEGETLADRLRRGPLPVEEALAIGAQIAEALEAAHEKGVVHRDLKPANVKVAYSMFTSDTTGIFVEPFPRTGAKSRISPNGIHPLWSPDGTELIFSLSGGVPVVTPITTEPGIELGSPVQIPRSLQNGGLTAVRAYDFMPDGKRLVGIVPSEPDKAGVTAPIQVVLNWAEELKQKVAVAK